MVGRQAFSFWGNVSRQVPSLSSKGVCCLGDGFKHFFNSYHYLEEMIQFDLHVFSDGLVQPPASFFFVVGLVGIASTHRKLAWKILIHLQLHKGCQNSPDFLRICVLPFTWLRSLQAGRGRCCCCCCWAVFKSGFFGLIVLRSMWGQVYWRESTNATLKNHVR